MVRKNPNPVGVSQLGSTSGGANLGKMAKNCTKITKSAFLGQKSGGGGGGGGHEGDKPIFRVVRGVGDRPPVHPTRGNPVSY